MRQMYCSVCIDLPADEFEEAAAKVKIKPLWEALIAGLQATGLPHHMKLETLEVRAEALRHRQDARAPQAGSGATAAPGDTAAGCRLDWHHGTHLVDHGQRARRPLLLHRPSLPPRPHRAHGWW